jgi:TPR repeat protein
MKLKRFIWVPLLTSLASASHLPAQQAETDRKVFEETRVRAEKGDAASQFNLGMLYVSGKGVSKDEAEAVRWLRKAAEQDYAEAQFNLGNHYHKGEGVARPPQEKSRACSFLMFP